MRGRIVVGALVAALVAGCATVSREELAAADHTECTAGWKLDAGSEAYALCRAYQQTRRDRQQAEGAARMQAFGAALQSAGAQMSGAPALPGMAAHHPGGVATTCFKTTEYTSGFNKVCMYNCLGSATAHNVANTQLCPLTISQ